MAIETGVTSLRSPCHLQRPKVLVVPAIGGCAPDLERQLHELGCAAVWLMSPVDDGAELVQQLQPDLVLVESSASDRIDNAPAWHTQLRVPVLYLDHAAWPEHSGQDDACLRIGKPFTTRELGLAMELALRRHRSESDHRLRDEAWELVFENGPMPMLLCLPFSSITRVNRSFLELSGYARAELIGRSVEDVGLRVDDKYGLRVKEALAQRDQVTQMRVNLRRKNGTLCPVRISTKTVTIDGTAQFLHLLADISAQKAALDDARLMRQAVASIAQGVAICGPDRLLLSVNPAFAAMTGYAAQDLIGRSCAILQGADTAPPAIAALTLAFDAGQAFQREMLFYRKGGTPFWSELSIDTVRDEDGELTHFLLTLRDINERRSQLAQIQLAAKVFELAHEGITITDAQGRILMVNKAFTDISGYAAHEVIGRNPNILASGRQGPEFYQAMWNCLRQKGLWQGELWNRRKDGSNYPQWLTISVLHDDKGRISNYIGTFSDLSAEREASERIRWLSQFDPLTGLPNRSLLTDRCVHAIRLAEREAKPLSLMVMGVDRFTLVNDTLGHRAGDKLLRKLAARLSEAIRDQDTLARFGSDEFVLVLPGDAPQGARQMAERLTQLAAHAFAVNDTVVEITISIGISVYPADGTDFETLFTSAQAAMRQAKDIGPGSFCFLNTEMFKSALEQATLGNALRTAVARHELDLNYQPFVDLQTGEIGGMEALLRWNHPELGSVSPARFIPVAERSGQIIAIGEWVMHQTCRDICLWRAAGLRVPAVSINLSPVQFKDPTLVRKVRDVLAQYQVDASQIYLELTEGALMDDVARSESQMRALKALGVQLSLDDFGTGYSSLSYLKRFPFDKVKIDKSFVRDIQDGAQDAVIVKVVISMAHGLGLRVIAEGVETETQCEFLRANVCDEIQGYFFSRPIPMQAMQDLLREKRRLAPHLIREQAKSQTLLLVDDEPNVLAALRRVLRRDGYRILTADSGPQGLQLLASNPVDIIVSDQRMPGMTGVEFLRQAKTLYPNTIRIVLSGHTELRSVTDAINEGAIYRFLTKPWDDGQLRGVIQDAFHHKDLAVENEQLNLKIRTANQELATSNRRLQEVLDQQQDELSRGQQNLDAMQGALQAIPLPVIALDDRGMISFANSQVQQLFGKRGLLPACRIADVLPEVHALLAGAPAGETATTIDERAYQVFWRATGESASPSGTIVTLRVDHGADPP